MGARIETLENGAKIALRPYHLSQLVTVQVWVNVGSLDESAHERGMSHLLEHMLFKGTKTRGVGEIAKSIEALGGDINAYTSFERTVYYATLPAFQLEAGIEILADAIFNSTLDAKELEREKEVVIEEIRRSLDNPAALLGRKIFEHAFSGCEAQRPIIGVESEVKNFAREDLVSFYERWYQPKNFYVVITGDFDPSQAYPIAAREFSKFSRMAHEPKRIPARAGFPSQPMVEILSGDYQQPRLDFCFQAPDITQKDAILLDVGAHILGSGDACRLQRRLKDELQLVSGITAYAYTPSFGGIFSVSSSPVMERFLPAAKAIAEEISSIFSQHHISAEELQRAKTNIKADHWYEEETVGGLARSLGHGLSTPFGEHFDSVYLNTIEEASAQDVEAALKRWINPARVILAAQIPQNQCLSQEDLLEEFKKGFVLGARGNQTTKANTPSLKKTTSDTTCFDIAEGITLIHRKIEDARFFSLVAAKQAGLRMEDETTAGLCNAISGLLGKASKTFDFETMLKLTENHGASLDGFSGKDSLGLRLLCFRENAELLLEAFCSVLKEPVFPAQQWEALKLEILEDIKAEDDHPSSIAFREFQNLLFGPHPYRFPQHGLASSVGGFNERILEEYFALIRDQGPWVFCSVSSFDAERTLELLKKNLHPWKPAQKVEPEFSSQKYARDLPKPRLTKIEKKREQCHIVVGYRGLNWSDPRRYALEVLSTILSGQGGRLFLELRDRDSLAYTVSSIVNFGVDPGIFGAYIACAPDKAEKARLALIEKLKEIFTTHPPLDEEIERAKNYLIGSHGVEMQRAQAQAMNMALMELYGVGHEEFKYYESKIREVKKADLLAVAKTLIDDSHLIQVLVG